MRRLVAGHDTIECAYYLYAPDALCELDFEKLAAQREDMRSATKREDRTVQVGGDEFLLAGHGTESGFPFVMSNADYILNFGEYNKPSFYVKYRSEALWRHGPLALHYQFLSWAEGMGLVATESEGLSRVDFAFDYELPTIDFDVDSIVSLSDKDSFWRNNGKLQTMQFGVGDMVLRIYDKIAEIKEKSGKVWFAQLWETFEDVWRIEWQVRKDALKRFGIRTFNDLDEQQGNLLRYLAKEHDTLRIPGQDSNRSRWPLHPLWRDLHDWIEEFDAADPAHDVSAKEILKERRARIGVAVYGYVKRLAAILALLDQREEMPVNEAIWDLNALLNRTHDAGTWTQDVGKRIDAMRLGS